MRFGSVACLCLALWIGLLASAVAAADLTPVPDRLSQAEVEHLRQHHVLVTQASYRQIFEAYLKSDRPVFITSDALIRAFHVLLDDALFRFEQLNALSVSEVVHLLWHSITPRKDTATKSTDRIPGSPDQAGTSAVDTTPDPAHELKAAALTRAQFAVGVALRLLGDTSTPLPEALVPLVEREVLNIVRASDTRSPAWPEGYDDDLPPIDYAVFRPLGFYTRSEALQRYYRTIRWFQTFPFSIERDDELLAILILGKSLATLSVDNRVMRLRIEKFFKCHRELTGDGDGFDILMAAQIRRDRPADLDSVRNYIYKTSAASAGPDSTRARFFVIAPSMTSDTLLFQKTVTLEDFARRRPNGLEMCAAIGSDYARNELMRGFPPPYGELLIAAIDDSAGLFDQPGLFNSYLRTLSALADPAEPDAPAFLSGAAWQAKSCNTILSGWVQFRHRFGINVVATDHAGGETLEGLPPGFVEPDPEFFGRLGDLVDQLNGRMERCGVFAPARYRIAYDLRQFARLIDEKKYLPGPDRFNDLNEAEVAMVTRSKMILEVVGNLQLNQEAYRDAPRKMVERILDFAKGLEMGEYDDDPTYQAMIIEGGLDTKLHWQSLRQMCRWLESLAHKQLREVPFNQRDVYFLAEFGERLASVMLYGGYGYLHPRDNTPAVVRIHSHPDLYAALYAGIGRPREILVLYPFGGKKILCRGAVLPYFEFVGASEFSDIEWKQRLDSDERPQPPKWVAPVLLSSE